MIRTDEPCEDCLVLAICLNKKWFEIPHTCSKVRRTVYGMAKLELLLKPSIKIRIKPLKKTYTVTKSSNGELMMLGSKR